MSDANWISDESTGPINIMIQNAKFRARFVEDSTPETMKETELNFIEQSIEACTNRIMILKGSESAGENAINSLNNELEKLKNPTTNPFHWDLSVYEQTENELDDSDVNSDNNSNNNNNNNESDNESKILEEVDDGRNTPYKISTVFSVGRRKKNVVPSNFTYDIGDFVVMPQGYFYY